MNSLNAKVEKEILELGVSALKEKLFTHGVFWCGKLDNDQFDLFGTFVPSDSLETSVFDLSSMTKALATTPMVLREAWSRGHFVTDTLEKVFPKSDFSKIESTRALVLADVLRHEAGLPFWRNFFTACEGQTQSIHCVIESATRKRHLDHRNVYSDISMILLGFLLETSHETTLADLFQTFLVHDLSLNPDRIKLGPSWIHRPEDCIETAYCPLRARILKGEVHDENASVLGGYTGHTGLFGSAKAVITYLRALNQSNIGRRVIRENSNWAALDSKSDSALGWRTGRDQSSIVFGDGRSIGHMGFTGTAFWLDPYTKSFAVLLTNRVAMARTENLAAMRTFRREIFKLMYQYILTVEVEKS